MLLLKEGDYLVIRLSAVLYSVHAVFKRNAHTLGAFDMGGYYESALMRLVARSLDYLGRHFQRARLALDLCVKHTAGYHKLY